MWMLKPKKTKCCQCGMQFPKSKLRILRSKEIACVDCLDGLFIGAKDRDDTDE